MVYPIIAAPKTTTLTTYGGDVIIKIHRYLSNTDIGSIDPTDIPQINTDTRYRTGRLQLYLGATAFLAKFITPTYGYNVDLSFPTTLINAETEPNEFVFTKAVQTLFGKNIDATTNPITNIKNSNIASDAAIDSSKLADNALIAFKNTANTFTQPQTIQVTTTFPLILYRDSSVQNSSNATNYQLKNNASPTPEIINYAQVNVLNASVVDGAEQGDYRINVMQAGVLGLMFRLFNNTVTLGISPKQAILDLSNITSQKTYNLPNQSGEIQTINATQTVSNKSQSARDSGNTFNYVRKHQAVEAYGAVQMRGWDIIGEGHFEGIQWYGNLSTSDNDSSGYYQRLISPAVVGGFAGLAHFSSNQASFRRDKNGWVSCKHQLLSTDYPLASERFFFGLYDQLALLPDSDTLLSNTQSGFFIAFRTGIDTNYMILYNDGTGVMQVTDTLIPFPVSSTVHELEIKMDISAGITWIIRNSGGTILGQDTINTRIPATSTKLYFYYGVQGNGKTILIRNCECKTGGH